MKLQLPFINLKHQYSVKIVIVFLLLKDRYLGLLKQRISVINNKRTSFRLKELNNINSILDKTTRRPSDLNKISPRLTAKNANSTNGWFIHKGFEIRNSRRRVCFLKSKNRYRRPLLQIGHLILQICQ